MKRQQNVTYNNKYDVMVVLNMENAAPLEKGAVYLAEIENDVNPEMIEAIMRRFKEKTGAELVIHNKQIKIYKEKEQGE